MDAYSFGRAERQQAASALQARAATRSATRGAWAGHCIHLAQKDVQHDREHDHGGSCHSIRVVTCLSDTYLVTQCKYFCSSRLEPLPTSVVFLLRRMSEERSTRVRGDPHPGNLRSARSKYKKYDETAAIEWLRLNAVNSRKQLTPELNAVEHARWYHLCDLRQKKV